MKTFGIWLFVNGFMWAYGTAAMAAPAPDSATQVKVSAPSSINETDQKITPLAGTLFFAPAERERMDRLRKRPTLMIEGVVVEPPPSVVNGFVKRSDGQSAVWVDGQPRYNVKSANMARLQPTDVGGVGTAVMLQVPGATAQAPIHTKLRVKKTPPRKSLHTRTAKKK